MLSSLLPPHHRGGSKPPLWLYLNLQGRVPQLTLLSVRSHLRWIRNLVAFNETEKQPRASVSAKSSRGMSQRLPLLLKQGRLV